MSWFTGLVLVFCHIVFHEGGHYLAARLFGFNPEFKFTKRFGMWSGVAVKTRTVMPETIEAVPLVAVKVMICGASGCLGVLPVAVASYVLGDSALLWYVVPLMLYSIVETVCGCFLFLRYATRRLGK